MYTETQREDFVRTFSEGGVQRLPPLFGNAKHSSPETKAPVTGKNLRLLRSKVALM